ncbi:hypothetical protein ABBQ38_007116 [Trebouxia sp. C0009 RCD-2024]
MGENGAPMQLNGHQSERGIEGRQAGDFLQKVAAVLCSYVTSQSDQNEPVVRLASPDKLKQHFEKAGIPLELPDGQAATPTDSLLAGVSTALQYSVRTGHPGFFNQLYARADAVSIAADWLAVAANTNVHTYEVAPVFTAVEVEVLSKLARCVGGQYATCHDGLFAPGGSISNIYGMHLARNHADPDYRTRGAFGGPHMVAFTSEHAHYSYLKAAFLTGLGTDNLIKVECNDVGQMLPEALDQALATAREQGKVPFFVGTTAGTTVLGAFDPFEQIAAICKKHGVWMHVDGCWGAAALLTPEHRHLMKGCELSDSLAWNPHKLMGLPLQCSAFLTTHKGLLQQSNASNATYLFQPDKLNREYDLGDKTIQCGRRADAFKLWLAWKAYGDKGYEARVTHSANLAIHFEQRIKASDGAYVLSHPRSFVNVCFWWVPPPLRPFQPATASQQDLATLDKVAPKIKDAMQQAGDAMIGFQRLQGLPNFFRIVFPSAWTVSAADLDALLTRIEGFGNKLFPALQV